MDVQWLVDGVHIADLRTYEAIRLSLEDLKQEVLEAGCRSTRPRCQSPENGLARSASAVPNREGDRRYDLIAGTSRRCLPANRQQ